MLQLPSDYRYNAETTDTVDRQVPVKLLEKATRLCGIGDFRIGRRNFGANASSVDPQTAEIEQQIQSYRLILNPAVLDSIKQHSDTSDGEQLDPRSVSVAGCCPLHLQNAPVWQPPNSN